ncbi:MAG TPA: ATP-binding protein [Verrucomicrobiae bacterium]|nr:ATP-binding protein [Verrucomicrobiae bacterium]
MTLVILLASTVALVHACVAFVHQELGASRQALVRDLTVMADVLGRNSLAALQFDDPSAAENMLLALQAKPHLVAACLYTAAGQRFATFVRPGAQPEFPSEPGEDGYRFGPNRFTLFHSIRFDQKTMGTIYLESDLGAINDRVRSFAKIAVLVLLVSTALTMAISFWLERLISRPILALAETARAITENRDYSVRANAQGGSEIGLLTDSFNQMLAQIQAQDEALRRAHDDLDHRVQERTIELRAAITALRAEIAERRRTEEERDRFFSMSLDLLCIADLTGRFNRVNPAWEKALGFTTEELLARPFIEFVHPDDRPATEAEIEKLRSGIDTVYFENRYVCKNGSYRQLAWSCPAPVPGQSVVYAAARDITERRLAQEKIQRLNEELALQASQLQTANKELEAFCYSVSHDLRAPLRGIDGFSQALLEDYGGQLDEAGKNLLQRIRAGTQRMGQLIDDLLDLSRVSRGELRRETVNLSELASSVVDELHKRDPRRSVELRIAKDLEANGDPHLLCVALENLLGNAWKYTAKQPRATIEFGLNRNNGHSAFFVRDDGVGFDMQYAGKLFAPFQRLHGMKEFPGTGVGLATVQRIIHRHGGRIWAEAEVNKGATFYFTLS